MHGEHIGSPSVFRVQIAMHTTIEHMNTRADIISDSFRYRMEFHFICCALALVPVPVSECAWCSSTGADRYILKDKRLLRVDWYH